VAQASGAERVRNHRRQAVASSGARAAGNPGAPPRRHRSDTGASPDGTVAVTAPRPPADAHARKRPTITRANAAPAEHRRKPLNHAL